MNIDTGRDAAFAMPNDVDAPIPASGTVLGGSLEVVSGRGDGRSGWTDASTSKLAGKDIGPSR